MALLSKEAILSVLIVYFFSNFGQKHNLFALLMKIYQLTDSFICYANSILSPEYFQFNSLKNKSSNEEGSDNKEFKPEPKYEDKYLEDIKKLNKEYIFNEEEEGVKLEKYTEFVSTLKENKLVIFLNKLSEIDEKLKTYEKVDDDYFVCDSEDEDFEEQNKILLEEKANNEEQTKILLEEKANVQFEYNKLITYLESNEGKEEIMKDATDLATKYVINQRLEKLKNCFVLEKTPLGNVLMFYNHEKLAFEYYSDSTIPYRYLETVSRKYVLTYKIRIL